MLKYFAVYASQNAITAKKEFMTDISFFQMPFKSTLQFSITQAPQ